MKWKQEVSLPGEGKYKDGRIISCDLNPWLMVAYNDIHSRKLPEYLFNDVNEQKPSSYLNINYCFDGRCEMNLKDGQATFLEGKELAIDCGSASFDGNRFYYPAALYQGIEIVFTPCKELDKALKIGDSKYNHVNWLIEANAHRERPITIPENQVIKRCMEDIRNDILDNSPKELIFIQVCRLLEILRNTSFDNEKPRTYYTSSQVKIARRVMEIITTDLSVRYTAAELAKQFMVSETSLKNYFRGVYGKGYREFINELRMERAAELLLENKYKVSEISEMVGFATQSRFAKAFKNYWDKSPLEYKRSCGEGMK